MMKMNLYISMTKTNTITQYKMSEPRVANIVGFKRINYVPELRIRLKVFFSHNFGILRHF